MISLSLSLMVASPAEKAIYSFDILSGGVETNHCVFPSCSSWWFMTMVLVFLFRKKRKLGDKVLSQRVSYCIRLIYRIISNSFP